jgi:hypothetical protein
MTMRAWRELYQSAMVEIVPAELQNRIDVANKAMNQRVEELAGRNDIEAIEERRQLSQALESLRTLRRLECPSSLSPTSPGRTQEGVL